MFSSLIGAYVQWNKRQRVIQRNEIEISYTTVSSLNIHSVKGFCCYCGGYTRHFSGYCFWIIFYLSRWRTKRRTWSDHRAQALRQPLPLSLQWKEYWTLKRQKTEFKLHSHLYDGFFLWSLKKIMNLIFNNYSPKLLHIVGVLVGVKIKYVFIAPQHKMTIVFIWMYCMHFKYSRS